MFQWNRVLFLFVICAASGAAFGSDGSDCEKPFFDFRTLSAAHQQINAFSSELGNPETPGGRIPDAGPLIEILKSNLDLSVRLKALKILFDAVFGSSNFEGDREAVQTIIRIAEDHTDPLSRHAVQMIGRSILSHEQASYSFAFIALESRALNATVRIAAANALVSLIAIPNSTVVEGVLRILKLLRSSADDDRSVLNSLVRAFGFDDYEAWRANDLALTELAAEIRQAQQENRLISERAVYLISEIGKTLKLYPNIEMTKVIINELHSLQVFVRPGLLAQTARMNAIDAVGRLLLVPQSGNTTRILTDLFMDLLQGYTTNDLVKRRRAYWLDQMLSRLPVFDLNRVLKASYNLPHSTLANLITHLAAAFSKPPEANYMVSARTRDIGNALNELLPLSGQASLPAALRRRIENLMAELREQMPPRPAPVAEFEPVAATPKPSPSGANDADWQKFESVFSELGSETNYANHFAAVNALIGQDLTEAQGIDFSDAILYYFGHADDILPHPGGSDLIRASVDALEMILANPTWIEFKVDELITGLWADATFPAEIQANLIRVTRLRLERFSQNQNVDHISNWSIYIGIIASPWAPEYLRLQALKKIDSIFRASASNHRRDIRYQLEQLSEDDRHARTLYPLAQRLLAAWNADLLY